jgi:hypothetical protein
MKQVNAQRGTASVASSLTAKPVHSLREDEAHQEHMRRLHNARASQRAARSHRVARASL